MGDEIKYCFDCAHNYFNNECNLYGFEIYDWSEACDDFSESEE